jgi:hypothetical protein
VVGPGRAVRNEGEEVGPHGPRQETFARNGQRSGCVVRSRPRRTPKVSRARRRPAASYKGADRDHAILALGLGAGLRRNNRANVTIYEIPPTSALPIKTMRVPDHITKGDAGGDKLVFSHRLPAGSTVDGHLGVEPFGAARRAVD